MIKYRIFTSGNIFYLIDIEDDNRIYEGHKKDILIKRNFDGDTTFFIYKLDDWDITRKLTIGEIEDADNVTYTLTTFVEFFDKETGNFNSASGGSGAEGLRRIRYLGVNQVPSPVPPFLPITVDTYPLSGLLQYTPNNVPFFVKVVDNGFGDGFKFVTADGSDLFHFVSGVKTLITEFVCSIGQILLITKDENGYYISIF